MENCIFCKIINREIPSEFLYEDEKVVVFKDINPQAPIHLLIVPKEHIESAMDINDHNKHIIGHIYKVASDLGRSLNLSKGYRIVNNCKEDGGQTVDHIHFHFLGGREMIWPAG